MYKSYYVSFYQALEKEALGANVRSKVVTDLLPLIDNFDLAAANVKPETEGEEKINNSYQVSL